MTDALVDTVSEYLKSALEISPERIPSNEEEEIVDNQQQQLARSDRTPHVTALTLPEPRKPILDFDERNSKILELEKDAAAAAHALNAAVLFNQKSSNTGGIIYRDYISDSSDLNSDTSPIQANNEDHPQLRQSTGDLTIISKAVSVDTHNSSDVSSSVVPAERNPVSDLLRSPASSDDEDTAMSEYYSVESLHKKLTINLHNVTSSSDSIPSQPSATNLVVSTTNNEPPPPPPPSSSLKKILHYEDHKLIPDLDEKEKESAIKQDRRESKVLIEEKQQEHTIAMPTIQPNRFITMEEELESQSGDLYIAAADDEEIEELNKLSNNLSMMDLSLPSEKRPVDVVRTLEQRRSIKRLNAMKELMETEETYSRDLGILCTHFFAIIKEATCISQEDADILVRNAMDILVFQEKFTEALIDAHGDDEEEKNGIFYKGNLRNIASCFVEWGPKFEIYLDYCVRQDHAVSVYNELLQTNDEFSNLIERLHTFHRVSFGFSRLKFDDYLIIPFQRIFRYRLLLQSITKATQKDSEEYNLLSKAQNTIHIIATRINNEKSKMEAKRKTALFLSRLDADWCLPKRWFNTLGVCSLIGTLEVRYIEADNKAKRIGCALFNHYMIMAKAKKHKLYEPRHWFPLRKFEIENSPNTEGSLTYSWLLRSDEHTLELSAICELEKHIWMEALSKAIKESKELYSSSVDSNEYLLEQLFVSSFDQHAQPKSTNSAIEPSESPTYFPIPSGSTSFSQSAIFNSKSTKNDNRSSQPVFGSHEFAVIDTTLSKNNNGARSPGLRSQSSISDLREFFSSNVTEKWSQRKFNQYHTRCKSVDTKFDDVCTTPILTARANSMNRNGSTSKKQKQMHSNNDLLDPLSAAASPGIHPLDGIISPLNPNSRRPSSSSFISTHTDSMIFRLAQRNSNSVNRSDSVKSTVTVESAHPQYHQQQTAGLLPPSNSTQSLRPSKFFGRMVEKLGQIGTPKSRRNHMMNNSSATLVNSSSKSTLSSSSVSKLTLFDQQDLTKSTSTKRKFFPHFLQSRHHSVKK